MSTRYDPRMHHYEEQTRFSGMIYVLMLVIAVAFGGFLWNVYSAPNVPRLAPPAGAYKTAPPADAQNAPDEAENSLYTSLEGRSDANAPVTPAPAPETPMVQTQAQPAVVGPPQLAATPNFVANGPFVAQVAALQSEAAVDPAWRRLSSRAPQLFAHAQLDVERADLGPRGIYYRVRAGYFADRENATRFCERIRQMGQDCIAVAR